MIVQHHVENEPQVSATRGLGNSIVKRITFNASQPGAGVIEHLRAVGVSNHRLARRPYGHRLARPGITRILMRLDETGRDEEIRFVGRSVDRKRDATLGNAQIYQRPGILRFVIDHPITFHHGLA